jgi:hypothetical protein
MKFWAGAALRGVIGRTQVSSGRGVGGEVQLEQRLRADIDQAASDAVALHIRRDGDPFEVGPVVCQECAC